MMTVSGIIAIPSDVKIDERATQYGVYFNFSAISKDPYQNRRQWHQISIKVPLEDVNTARDALTPGRIIFIRVGELCGRRLPDSQYVAMNINTKWHLVEPLRVVPTPERKNPDNQ